MNDSPAHSAYDVAIIGGGVIGSAVAYSLAAGDAFAGRILVIERDPTYGTASTPRAVGGVRQQFSTTENIQMSLYSAEFFRCAADHLAVESERVDLGFVEAGYLFLATRDGWPTLEANHKLQKRLGADVALLARPDLAARFPWLNVDDLAGGSLGLSREGWIDPHALLAALSRKARSLGVEFVRAEAIALHHDDSRIHAVTLAGGRRIDCRFLVNAAGPYAAEVAAMARVVLPVRPRKRQVFVIDCRTPPRPCPMAIDPTGLYFRPEGDLFVCGIAPPPELDPDTLDTRIDHDFFEQRVWPLLAHRAPAFESVRCVNAWAGPYEFNTVDHNGIIGRHPAIENLIFANGFSGHGLQQSPAVGRAVAELIAHGEFRSLDLSRLGFDRFAKGQPLPERNVV